MKENKGIQKKEQKGASKYIALGILLVYFICQCFLSLLDEGNMNGTGYYVECVGAAL